MSPPSGDVVSVPIDLLGEQVVLAAAIVSDDRRAGLVRRIAVDQFQHADHKALWGALGELVRRGLVWSPQTVSSIFGDAVNVDYAEQLAATFAEVPVDLDHHVDRVQWDAARANAARGPVAALLEVLRDPRGSPERTRSLGRQVAEALGEYRDRRFLRDPSAVVRSMAEELAQRASGIAVHPYGIEGLDVKEDGKARLIPGAKPGKVTVITGVSGSGKSTISIRVGLGQARRRRRVLYGAWEMTAEESLELMAVMSLAEQDFRDQLGLPVSRSALMEGSASAEMAEAVRLRGQEIGQYVRFVDNPFGRVRGEKRDASANDRNLDLVHQMISDTGADVFVADLFERCLRDTDPDDEKHALFRMQAIAEETKCHAVLNAQQKLKEVEQRDDKHPTRDCIKGSSAWVDIADTIFGPHRPAQWKAVPDEVVEVDILKQRYGPWPMRVELEWAPDRGWFGKGTTVPYTKETVARAEGVGELNFTNEDGAPPARKGRRR